jgi:hypothetical protein
MPNPDDQEREALAQLVRVKDLKGLMIAHPAEYEKMKEDAWAKARAALAAREEPLAQTHEYEMPEGVIVELAKREVIAEIVKRPFLLAIFNGPSPDLDALAESIARAVLAVTGAAREEESTSTPCPTCGGPLEGGEGSRCSRSACPTNLMTIVPREDTERTDAETLARRFHETYERFAPDYGYKTREASAVPWDEVPDANRSLMIAVCRELQGDHGRYRCA